MSIVASIPLLAANAATATLVVRGTISRSVSVAVSGSGNTSLALESPLKKQQIATLTAFANDNQAFSLSVSSQWRLSGAQDNIPYSLTINNKTLDKDGVFFSSDGKKSSSEAAMAVFISTDPPTDRQLPADTYSDTITFTITAP
jgi:hypothetical protein